ncbi:hypothetical protein TB2_040273 [Malus domestica]|uniref:Uncharacterized protein n=1 Tax=Malus domestica TaxID=3750 RepID=A0A498JHW5_MALDO|nr:hypothetical protein DVH24_013848 [Malus domestica]
MDASVGSYHGSPTSNHRTETSPVPSMSAEVSYPLAAQVMTIDATFIEEQLAQMNEAITKLTKTVEDKDMLIAALMSQLES